MGARITIADLLAAKAESRRIVAVSCYDYTTARLVAAAGVDMILVGDSASQVVLGFDSTLPATMDFMVAITAAVRRAAPDVLLVADMPFLSYQLGVTEAVKNAGRFAVQAGAQMIKIEATEAYLDVIKAVSDAGMAVMAHIGIRPQAIGKSGKLKAEATTAVMAVELIELAGRMLEAGALSLLLEGTATEVSEIVTANSTVPVIGCGAGPGCDGQILIVPDILGLTEPTRPKFAKNYAQLAQPITTAINQYSADVRDGKFPDAEHNYHMKPGQREQLKQLLKDKIQL